MAKYPRVGRITIGDIDYPACINLRVIAQLQDEGIQLENLLSNGQNWIGFCKIIAYAINAGYRLSGSDDTVDPDAIMDQIEVYELEDISRQIGSLINRASRTVQAEPPKN